MAVVVNVKSVNSFQNHSQWSCKAQRRKRQRAERTWASLRHRKAPMGDPDAGATANYCAQ